MEKIKRVGRFLFFLGIIIFSIYKCRVYENEKSFIGHWQVEKITYGETNFEGLGIKDYNTTYGLDTDIYGVHGYVDIRKDKTIEVMLDGNGFMGTWNVNGDSLIITKENAQNGETFFIDQREREVIGAEYYLFLREYLNGRLFEIVLKNEK